jgi:tight adherence protein C
MTGLESIIPLAIVVGTFVFTIVVLGWPGSIPSPPGSGERGQRRKEALAASRVFSIVEPAIRILAGQVALWPLLPIRKRAQALLRAAGRPLGLDGDDFLASSLLSAVLVAGLGAVLGLYLGRPAGAGAVLGFVFGATAPLVKIDSITRARKITVSRGIPHAIDLVALAMEAGLDFPGALEQVSTQLNIADPLRFEFEHLLHRLSLGWSRNAALKELAGRIPTAPVNQFVTSIIQAEKRGTPLAGVLSTQATVMREKRSQAAEAAAARAGIFILGPLMLIFSAVFVILLGPFVVKFVRGELF